MICYDCIYVILIYVIAFMFGRKFAATHLFIMVNLIFQSFLEPNNLAECCMFESPLGDLIAKFLTFYFLYSFHSIQTKYQGLCSMTRFK